MVGPAKADLSWMLMDVKHLHLQLSVFFSIINSTRNVFSGLLTRDDDLRGFHPLGGSDGRSVVEKVRQGERRGYDLPLLLEVQVIQTVAPLRTDNDVCRLDRRGRRAIGRRSYGAGRH